MAKKTASARERRNVLLDLKRTIEHSIKAATQSLKWVEATLKELEDSETPIPVVVKHRPAILIASIRSKVQTYEEIGRCEKELLATLPPRSVGEL